MGDTGLVYGSGSSPEEGNGNPLQCSCLENSMDKRSLVGYSPWGREESDRTERLTISGVEAPEEQDFICSELSP